LLKPTVNVNRTYMYVKRIYISRHEWHQSPNCTIDIMNINIHVYELYTADVAYVDPIGGLT